MLKASDNARWQTTFSEMSPFGIHGLEISEISHAADAGRLNPVAVTLGLAHHLRQ